MRVRLAIVVLAAVLAVPAAGHGNRDRVECEKVKQKIRKVEARMRQGYTRAQGERLAERLRELRALRSKFCR